MWEYFHQNRNKFLMNVLGIETSCDETGVAIYSSEKGLLADQLYSQIDLHAEYGGVVPELASRDHIRKLSPLIEKCLSQAGLQKSSLDGIAYTTGPGLAGALLVGAALARAFAWGLGLPAIGVHHMEGHLLAPMMETPAPKFPFIALLVSGGHTQLIKVTGIGEYELLGESLDDAAGEAFDKTAKLLDIGYPGGPAIAKLAEQGNPKRFTFPRPMVGKPGLDFSFSGLKTYTLTTMQQESSNLEGDELAILKADIARAFEDAAVDSLAIKCRRAMKQTGVLTLVIAGGVSANRKLRQTLADMTQGLGGQVYYPRPEFCTDNGAMIAFAGYHRLNAGLSETLAFQAKPRWPITELTAI